jgi:hypothetical protein
MPLVVGVVQLVGAVVDRRVAVDGSPERGQPRSLPLKNVDLPADRQVGYPHAGDGKIGLNLWVSEHEEYREVAHPVVHPDTRFKLALLEVLADRLADIGRDRQMAVRLRSGRRQLIFSVPLETTTSFESGV